MDEPSKHYEPVKKSKCYMTLFVWKSKMEKFTESERLAVAGSSGGMWGMEVTSKLYYVSLRGAENVLKLW